MKRFRSLAVAAVAGLMLAGCASVAHVEKDDSVNFQHYKTFSWVETQEATQQNSKAEEEKSPNEAEKQPQRISDLTERKIREAVNAELEKAGWKEVQHKPDVLLSYDVLVQKSVKEQNNPVYSRSFSRVFFNPYTRRWGSIYYPSQFLGFDRDAYSVQEGTVTISMIDARTNKTVWQGWTTDEVNSKNLTSREIQSSVRSIFRKFDVAKK